MAIAIVILAIGLIALGVLADRRIDELQHNEEILHQRVTVLFKELDDVIEKVSKLEANALTVEPVKKTTRRKKATTTKKTTK